MTALATFWGVTTVSHGLALFMFLNCLQNATLAPSPFRLSCLFSYSWPHAEYFFEKLVVAHLVNKLPLSYGIVRTSNISSSVSRLTRFCARWIRFVMSYSVKDPF